MESLLRWSIEHSTTSDGSQPQPTRSTQNLDPGVIDAILGKPDSELMKEALSVAVDDKKDEDERIQALDNFEMLVEQIDNANNIEKMKMWDPLHALLRSPSTSEEIKMQTLWIVGTAVQNNPSAQRAYLALSPMSTLVTFLGPSVKSAKLRSKAVYALSGFLKHDAEALRQFDEAGGWEALKAALEDSDIGVRRKTAFLFNSLIVPTETSHPTQLTSQASYSSSTSDNTGLTAHSSDSRPQGRNNTVHPNSHASMLSDPSSISTSPAALKAFEEHGILQSLVSAVTSPVPHGPDGETEGDVDFDEKVIRTLHTYVSSCGGRFSEQQKSDLRAHLKSEANWAGGDPKLPERWGLTSAESRTLKRAIA